jgi:hypothetical protein
MAMAGRRERSEARACPGIEICSIGFPGGFIFGETGISPTPNAPETQSEPTAETPPVTMETRMDQAEGRKQMVIHNRGSPIIPEFGYERK